MICKNAIPRNMPAEKLLKMLRIFLLVPMEAWKYGSMAKRNTSTDKMRAIPVFIIQIFKQSGLIPKDDFILTLIWFLFLFLIFISYLRVQIQQLMSERAAKGRPLNRKDKQKLREKHRQELEMAKMEKQKEMARREIRKLQDTGIVEAYESFLRNICKFGLPEPRNVYEMAAQHVLKHEKKMQQKNKKKTSIMEYNSAALRSSSPPAEKSVSPKKSKR